MNSLKHSFSFHTQSSDLPIYGASSSSIVSQELEKSIPAFLLSSKLN